MVPEINIWAVLLATASSMVVGAIGYSRQAFGTSWMSRRPRRGKHAHGLDRDHRAVPSPRRAGDAEDVE
ncbi:DUF1761 domain-containing protein [Cryobacterium sp. M25]|uniref:DUF1761 domain-containing protein n=1 Tax=Cryobacterium sp. M25 TaxID=2048293 RepID=UPI0035154315